MHQRFTLLTAVHLFLIQDNKILLARRFNTGYEDGKYSVPAGHVDGDEPITLAMSREAKEEVGIEIAPNNLQVIHVMHRKSDQERVDFFLTATQWSGEPTVMEKDKCDDIQWFELNNLPENIIPYVKFAIEQYQSRNHFSEFGWE